MGLSVSFNILSNIEKVLVYSKLNKDILNIRAIFSDETENFRQPIEPLSTESVKVSIRVAKNNVDFVFIHYDDKKIQMKKEYSEGTFDYYFVMLPPEKETKSYYFEIEKGNSIFYYTKIGITQNTENMYYFTIIRDFKTPDWAKGAVMYQIFTDRFYNGDKTNDVKTDEYIYLGRPVQEVQDWDKCPSSDDIRNFYGGDLQGVIDKMEYLKNLGVEVIYFNPIFVSPSNHKYDAQDYDYVDPHFGIIVEDGGEPLKFEKFNNRHATMYVKRTTDKVNLKASNELFIKLVKIAHSKGIRIILDGVFNHCGAFNKWLDREGFYGSTGKYPVGAYKEKNSIYNKYFRWYDTNNWPNNDCYDGWWGYDNHPKLNFEESSELYEYIMQVGRKWVSPPYNADGWRLDVAADLGYSEEFNHKFWRDFRKSVKEANPNAIILAEHYGDASAWLKGDQWDTIMNYDAFMEPVTWFLTGMEKHSEDYKADLLCNAQVFKDTMRYNMAKLSAQSVMTSMNQLSNHDHSRFLTRTNMTVGRLHTKGSDMASFGINKGIMKEAVVIQMTWIGSPTVYYGDEAGVVGWTDPDNRRTYPWGKEDMHLLNFHKEMIHIRKKYKTLRKGSLEYLYTDYGVLSYGRFDSTNKLVVVLNNTDYEKDLMIPVWQVGVQLEGKLCSLITSDKEGYSLEKQQYTVKGGILNIKVPSYGSIVLLEEK